MSNSFKAYVRQVGANLHDNLSPAQSYSDFTYRQRQARNLAGNAGGWYLHNYRDEDIPLYPPIYQAPVAPASPINLVTPHRGFTQNDADRFVQAGYNVRLEDNGYLYFQDDPIFDDDDDQVQFQYPADDWSDIIPADPDDAPDTPFTRAHIEFVARAHRPHPQMIPQMRAYAENTVAKRLMNQLRLSKLRTHQNMRLNKNIHRRQPKSPNQVADFILKKNKPRSRMRS